MSGSDLEEELRLGTAILTERASDADLRSIGERLAGLSDDTIGGRADEPRRDLQAMWVRFFAGMLRGLQEDRADIVAAVLGDLSGFERAPEALRAKLSVPVQRFKPDTFLTDLRLVLSACAIPDLAFASGFDEIRVLPSGSEAEPSRTEFGRAIDTLTLGSFQRALEAGGDPTGRDPEKAVPLIVTLGWGGIQALLRRIHFREESGAWVESRELAPRISEEIPPGDARLHKWISRAQERLQSSRSITLPRLATRTGFADSPVHHASRGILRALNDGKSTLGDLTWRQLEEVVAELLHAQGFEVEVTPKSRDGGRDVIARGELVPGEPMILAVEVKHRKTVGRADLLAALEANRRVPALLFATSGRFSAGVLEEKRDADRRLRLFLKDGDALGQWIAGYGRRNLSP